MIDQSSVSGWRIETASCFNGGEGPFGCPCQTKQAWPSACPPIKTHAVEDDWRLSLNLGEPGTCQGTGPTRRHSPCPRLYGATDKSWGSPWTGEPTRQEPALLSNHDGAAAPGPARLCNDLKQREPATGPHTLSKHGPQVRGGGGQGGVLGKGGRTWNLEPGTCISTLSQPHLNSELDPTRLDPTRVCPHSLSSRC